MAETPESGNERATVRLVAEMVGTVLAKIDGLAKLTEAQHEATQRQLSDVAGIPAKVAQLDARVKALERAHAWRLGTLPLVVIGVLGILVTVVVKFT